MNRTSIHKPAKKLSQRPIAMIARDALSLVRGGDTPGAPATRASRAPAQPDARFERDRGGSPHPAGISPGTDAATRTNVRALRDALTDLARLRAVRYQVAATGADALGLLAHEVEAVLPDVVDTGSDGQPRVNYAGVVAVAVQAIKELQASTALQLEQLAASNAALVQRLARLETEAKPPALDGLAAAAG